MLLRYFDMLLQFPSSSCGSTNKKQLFVSKRELVRMRIRHNSHVDEIQGVIKAVGRDESREDVRVEDVQSSVGRQ